MSIYRVRLSWLVRVMLLLAGTVIAWGFLLVSSASAETAIGTTPGCLIGQRVSSWTTGSGLVCGPTLHTPYGTGLEIGTPTGSLPPGIAYQPATTGWGSKPMRFEGTYTTAGRYIWYLNYRIGSGLGGLVPYTFTIWDGPPVFASGAQSTTGTVGVNVSVANGFVLPFSQFPNSFTYSGLPAGMYIHADTGVLYGKPTSAGTYTVNVTGSNSFGSDSGTIEITIAPGTQTLSFTNPGSKTMTSTPFALNVVSTSGLTPTVASTTPLVCSIDGLNVTMLGVGTCSLRATQDGNDSYSAATPLVQSFSISKGTQASLSITSTTATYGSPALLASSGGSGVGTVTYVVNSPGTAGCSLNSTSSTNLQFTSPGTCTLTATKAADANFNAASSPLTTITIGKATQAELQLTSTSGTFGTVATLTSSGGSGTGAVTYVVVSSGTAGCSITATSLTSTAGGTCSVRVDKALDTNYSAISSVVTTFTIGPRNQLATVVIVSPDEKTYGSSMTMGASGGSGTGSFTYSVVDAGTATCSISGNELISTGDVGSSCTVKVTKAGDASYLARESETQVVTVAYKALQPTLAVSSPTVSYRTPASLTVAGGEGPGDVTYSVTSAGSAGCSIIGNQLQTTGEIGTTCGVTATKASSTNYLLASSAEHTVTVTAKATQTVEFNSPADRDYAVTPFTVTAASDSGLPVVLASSTPSTCSVAGYMVSMHLPGVCTISAVQSGDGNYLPAATILRSFAISRANQLVSWSLLSGVTLTTSPLTMNPASGSDGGSITYSVLDQGSTNCVLPDPLLPELTFDTPGSCVLQAEASATATHAVGTSIKILVIAPATPTPFSSGTTPTEPVPSVTKIRSLDPIPAIGGMRPGMEAATVDGAPLRVRIEANATNTGLDVFGSGWSISIGSKNGDGPMRPLDQGGVLVFQPGSMIHVSGSGFDELAQVRVYLLSGPTHLGSLMTDHTGNFSGVLRIPMDVVVGTDTLQINGFTRERLVRSFSIGVRVKSGAVSTSELGTRIYFDYGSATLKPKAQKSLLALIAQVPSGAYTNVTVVGAFRMSGATAKDRQLAWSRTRAVTRLLANHGLVAKVSSGVKAVSVRDGYRDRRVEVSVRQPT